MEDREVKKNYWAEVAKVLGVELEEEINIICDNGEKSTYSPYMFTEEGLKDKDGDIALMTLKALASGGYVVDKLPWKPKEGEQYWYVVIGSDGIACMDDYVWNNHSVDMLNYKSGNCFRTEEEARQNSGKIIAMLKSDEVFKY